MRLSSASNRGCETPIADNVYQASFKALNIESEDDSEDEIDNTKEIQIEEALKIYQNALKFHSSRTTLDQAGQAYEELFSSDIFKFPESQSEYNRLLSLEGQQEVDDIVTEYIDDDLAPAPSATENAPSTLPQILHLSYKNRAEYYLDVSQDQFAEQGPAGSETSAERNERILELAQRALNDFSEALDKDEDDVDSWRRASRVSQALNTCRIARFCLEAALQGDDEGPDDVLSLPSFETKLDRSALEEVRAHLDDAHLVSNRGLISSTHKQSSLRVLKVPRHTALYPVLPRMQPLQKVARERKQHLNKTSQRYQIPVEEHSLDAVASALKKYLSSPDDALLFHSPVGAICLEMPAVGHDDPERNQLAWQAGSKGVDAAVAENANMRTSHTPSTESKADKMSSETPAAQEMQDRGQPASPVKIEPPLKRSSEVANLGEIADGERGKVRRTRARKSATGDRSTEANVLDLTPGGDPKHETYLQADRWLFELMKDVLRRMEVKIVCNADDIRRIVSPNSPYGVGEGFRRISLARAMQDFYSAMLSWTPSKTELLMRPHATSDHGDDGGNAGLLAFLDAAVNKNRKISSPLIAEASEFVDFVNRRLVTAEQAAVLLCQVLFSRSRPQDEALQWEEPASSTYLKRAWSDQMRETMEEILYLVNDGLVNYVDSHSERVMETQSVEDMLELAQSVFEMHLSVFTRSVSPTSTATRELQTLQKSHVDQWHHIARDWLTHFSNRYGDTSSGFKHPQIGPIRCHPLLLRHIWASVFSLKASGEIDREYLTLCIGDLKRLIRNAALSNGKITLHNNPAMTEISIDAADREIIKLDTMDFFLSIFQQSEQHPVDFIEKLEPILIPNTEASGGGVLSEASQRRVLKRSQTSPQGQSRHEILSEFVKKADFSLRRSLWYKLRNAYDEIEFPSKVLFVNFRILEVLINELQSLAFIHAEAEERERILLERLKDIHEVLGQISGLIDGKKAGLDSLDTPQLRSSTQNLVGLFTLLHTVTLYDDHSQALYKGPPLANPFRAYPAESFFTASKVLHEMQLRTFILVYKMLAEAALHLPERIVPAQASVDRYEYLQYVHYALGVRRLCKSHDSLFLRFMRGELAHLQLPGQPATNDVAQILYDMYDLRCFAQASEKQDHGCESDYLDRTTAMELVDFVLDRTKGASIKDLPKADLGKSVEKLQAALGPPTSSSSFAASRNRRLLSSFIKSPISPLELFQCLKGVGQLSTTPCPPQEAPLASKGWYFLIGMINLVKHKRSRDSDNSKVADDVREAVKFLTHDLEYNAENWETWFRLGYGYDWLLEEQVLWHADKLNDTDDREIVQLQRAALHAYSQAVSLARQSSTEDEDLVQKLATLYIEFAMRVYYSARPPFNMRAFGLDSVSEKLHSGAGGGGTYGRQLFQPLRPQQAMRVAATLCRRAISLKADSWL